MRYEYSVVRFVPDTLRGEFVNLGVIVANEDTDEWLLRFTENRKRAQKIDEEGVLGSAIAQIANLERMIEDHRDAIEDGRTAQSAISVAWLREFAVQSRNLVQLTPLTPISADTAEEAMKALFNQFVVDPETAERARYIPRSAAVFRIGAAYTKHLVGPEHLGRRSVVTTKKYGETFDFVVGNGRAVQLAQAFSFAVTGIDSVLERLKSWSWTVHDIRTEGGAALIGNRNVSIDPRIEIDAVIVEPTTDHAQSAFAEALRAFRDNDVEIVTADKTDEVATRAANLLNSVA